MLCVCFFEIILNLSIIPFFSKERSSLHLGKPIINFLWLFCEICHQQNKAFCMPCLHVAAEVYIQTILSILRI
uniref:Pre-pollination inflorescence-specific protein 4 n=2 Tax=Oryza sativa subsp. indica TaxID=39946 RepID=E6N0V6_ORYSI|nr:pre-pollination inflorescence-specific protein 4 [Oryza sativa Indica Group]